tara:strand:- start:346 stop:606 length:261 start_codon:yes stop_codon:yes gene_type:complete
MNIQEIHTWITNAKMNESIIYYTGHLAEKRDKIEIRKMANAFMEAAQQKKIDLFQNKITEGDLSKAPIYEYIARKLKDERGNKNTW